MVRETTVKQLYNIHESVLTIQKKHAILNLHYMVYTTNQTAVLILERRKGNEKQNAQVYMCNNELHVDFWGINGRYG